MSSFTEPLILEALASERAGRGMFRLYRAFQYEVGHLGSGDVVRVPAGFDTDLCSVPWFARAFIPLAGRVAKPALLHDWLLVIEDPRAIAVFDESLGVAGVSRVTRWLLVRAVRAWAFWKRISRLS